MEPSLESLLESSSKELSLGSDFSSVFSLLIPLYQGKYEVYQAEPPCLVRLSTSGRAPRIPDCAVIGGFTCYHSSHRHGTHTVRQGIFSRFTPLDPLCSAQTRSSPIGSGSSPHTDGLGCRRAMFICIYHPWRIAKSLPQDSRISLR